MTVHKHAEMIKAKADNMDLVVFGKLQPDNNSAWVEVTFKELISEEFHDYFLCIPQHDETCFHWLNDGVVQEKGIHADDYYWSNETADLIWSKCWHQEHIFMDDTLMTRIKTRKEKRWIIYNLDKDCVEQVFNSEASGFSDPTFRHSMHVIEVEV